MPIFISLFLHSQKEFAKASASVLGRLLTFIRKVGGAPYVPKREEIENIVTTELLSLLTKTDKTAKERFPILLYIITMRYPQILMVSRKLFQ